MTKFYDLSHAVVMQHNDEYDPATILFDAEVGDEQFMISSTVWDDLGNPDKLVVAWGPGDVLKLAPAE